MCIICRNEIKTDIKDLDCSGCQEIKEIPIINGLQALICNDCPLLSSIPIINGLQTLSCRNCPLLTAIPLINGLQAIDCSECPLLTGIPFINGLQALCCSDCPSLISLPLINVLSFLFCHYCPLLYIPFKFLKLCEINGEKSKLIGLKIKQKCKYIREKTKIKTLLRDEVLPKIKYSLSEYNYQMNQPLIMNCIFQYF